MLSFDKTMVSWMTSTSTARKRHRSSEKVLGAILDAAAQEFAAHGFDGASTRAIADRAGVF